MSRTIHLLFLITSTILGGQAQEYLVKLDGETIEYKKLKFKRGQVVLSGTDRGTSKKGQVVVDPGEVEGRYSLQSNNMYYMKPFIDFAGVRKFQFIERVMEGKIKVYERTVVNHSYNQFGGTMSSNTYLYLEKGDEYINVLSTNTIGQNKKEKLSKFKAMVQDDPIAYQRLSSQLFKHKIKNIKEVVKDYNLRAHQRAEPIESEVGRAIFFRGEEKQSDKVINLSVGNVNYTLQFNDSIAVNIPVGSETKVCVADAIGNSCELVKGSPYFETFYEVALGKSGKSVIEAREKEYAEYVLKSFELYRKKRNGK